jgi:hypothetical protein
MPDCIFCKIASGIIPSSKVYEDDTLFAFRDIHPQSPTHILIIPRQHYSFLRDMEDKDESLLGHMLLTANKIARRVVIVWLSIPDPREGRLFNMYTCICWAGDNWPVNWGSLR